MLPAVCTQLNFPHSGQETAPWHQTSLDWFSQRQGGTCPLLALCAESAPGPCKPPVWRLPSRHPVQTAASGTFPGSPTQPLGKAPLISAEYYVISFYLRCLLSFEPALWECSFQGRQWGTTEQTWWNHSARSVRPSSGFIIRKQSTQPQYKRCFYTLWLLNYLLIKSFIISALSTTLNVGYKKYWGPIWDEPEDLKGSLKKSQGLCCYFEFH